MRYIRLDFEKFSLELIEFLQLLQSTIHIKVFKKVFFFKLDNYDILSLVLQPCKGYLVPNKFFESIVI